jgi:hypothetical protein
MDAWARPHIMSVRPALSCAAASSAASSYGAYGILFGLKKVLDAHWSARLEMCQWKRETLDKESIWDEARSTSLSRW